MDFSNITHIVGTIPNKIFKTKLSVSILNILYYSVYLNPIFPRKTQNINFEYNIH